MDKDSPSPPILNQPAPDTMELLLSRRSGSAKTMTGPGPDNMQLRQILTAAARVPDHGKLFPWRFIVIEGEGRSRFGQMLADVLRETDSNAATDERLSTERGRFERAPVVVAVVSKVREMIPIPVWEQQLSAGAVCQTMLIAATSLGFVANWITEWPAYHPQVKERLGLKPGERIAGFVYIGHPVAQLEERVRPDMDKIVTHF
jgi:nitroreductase